MRVTVAFYSWFRDLTGCTAMVETLPPGTMVDGLLRAVIVRFPRLAEVERSILIAVGVEYQDRRCVLKEGDQISLFPPVQGG
jgi:molybdopterin converting factor small subunit